MLLSELHSATWRPGSPGEIIVLEEDAASGPPPVDELPVADAQHVKGVEGTGRPAWPVTTQSCPPSSPWTRSPTAHCAVLARRPDQPERPA